MIIPRTGKNILLDINTNWKINYGTFDVKNPVTLYIKLQTYLTPLPIEYNSEYKKMLRLGWTEEEITEKLGNDNQINGDKILDSIKIYRISNDSIFCSRFIHKTTFPSVKTTKKNKTSCLVITLTVKQKDKIVPFDMIQPHVETLVSDFISKITSQWNFNFLLKSTKN